MRQISHTRLRDDEFDRGPWLVSKGVSPAAYDTSILLYGDPSEIHECASGYIYASLVRQLGDAGKTLDIMNSPAYPLRTRIKEADVTVTPEALNFPTLVCEVAYSNENLGELYRELAEWVEPGKARVALGIKIQDARGRIRRAPTLYFILHQNEHDPITYDICRRHADTRLKDS